MQVKQIKLSYSRFALILAIIIVIPFISAIIIISPNDQNNFINGWACNEIHRQNSSDTNSIRIIETYPSSYCKSFAEAWDKELNSRWGLNGTT